uniref:Seprase n=1 Tax=Anthurium amnicola TaxID=1678845 RepID=A0A1D1Y153_9ARAE
MVREKDVCWEYCEKLEGNKVQCNFCQKILNGGISRLKHHLSRVPSKGVNPCSKVRDDVTERVKAIIASKEEGKEVASAKKQRLTEAARSPANNVSAVKVLSISAGPPLAKFFPSNTTSRQPQPGLDIERCIAEFFFENKLDFSVAHSTSYQLMLEALGGAGFRGPSVEALRTTWLEKLKSEVSLKIKEIENEWTTTGCTIIADTWTDNKSRALINFFVSSPSGTFFHKSVDASSYFKNTKHVSDLFDSVIQDVGSENVVQVIVDNALNYISVGNYITQKYGSIFWSPCASHCLSLILEDFCKIDWVNRCILQAQFITKFIYNNVWVLSLFRKYTVGQDIVRTSITKSASNFLSLQSMLKQKSRLKHMFNSPEYSASSYASRPHSISCIDILEDNQFWRAAEEIAAVSEPLLKVLRDVSGGKAAVGSIYESMTRAKESIRTYYIMDENKCKLFLDIVDKSWQHQLHSPLHAASAFLNPSIQYNPEVKFLRSIKEEFHAVVEKLLPTPDLRQDVTAEIFIFTKAHGMFGSNLAREARTTASPGMWWEQYGDSAPALQHVAVRVLSQVCSTAFFERNWSTFQQIHSEKRNKLDKEILNDFLFVHYNLKLQARGKPVGVDPIILEEMDMTSEWVEETENANSTQWLDRFSSLDGGDLNTRQFNSSIFGSNDHLFNL